MDICIYRTFRAYPSAAWVTDTNIVFHTFSIVAEQDAGNEVTSFTDYVCKLPDILTQPYSAPFTWFDGSNISPVLAGIKYTIMASLSLDKALNDPEIMMDQSSIAVLTANPGYLFAPQNRTLMRTLGLLRARYSSEDPRNLTVANLRIDFVSRGLETAQLILHANDGIDFPVFDKNKNRLTNIPDWTETFRKEEVSFNLVKPDNMTPESISTVMLECKDSSGLRPDVNGLLYVTAISGYVPKTVIPVTNGLAEFKIKALGLEAGDTLTMNFGWKSNKALETISIPVI